MLQFWRRLYFPAVVWLAACSSPAQPGSAKDPSAVQQAGEELPAAGNVAISLDSRECETNQGRLRPFVITWDATDQAEFAAQSQQSLLVVRLEGCELRLVPTCQIPGEYRLRETPGSTQSLELRSVADIYANATFSIATLAAELNRNKALDLSYHVRGLRYATAPYLYRKLLPAGCEEATHFVLNYAAGAFELSMSGKTDSQAAAGVTGIGQGGAKLGKTSAALHTGGNLASCSTGSMECTAPVRLRLLPILPGGPDATIREDVESTMTKPVGGNSARDVASLVRTMASAKPGLKLCYNSYGKRTGASAELEPVYFKAKFLLRADGVPVNVALDKIEGNVGDGFKSCVVDMLHGLRFQPADADATIISPFRFVPAVSDAKP